MTQPVARQQIAAAVEAARLAWPTYNLLVESENRTMVDHATQVEPYAAVDVIFDDAEQADMSHKPLQRVMGVIHLAVCVKEGQGTAKCDLVMAHMAKALSFKIMPLVKTKVARPQRPVSRKGWYCQLTLIDFWYHEPV